MSARRRQHDEAKKTMITRWAVCAGVMVALMGSGVSLASADELGVEVGLARNRVGDEAFQAVERNGRHPGFSLGLTYALERLSPDLEFLLWMQSGGQGSGGGQGSFQNEVTLDWRVQRAVAGVDWGPTLWGFFRPSVRGGVGYAHQRLEYVTQSGSRLRDHAHDLAGFGALGARLELPVGMPDETGRHTASIGLQFYAGYMGQTAAEFNELEPTVEDETWQREPVALGDIRTSGAFWNAAVIVRFSLF